MTEVFQYALVIGMGLGIGIKIAESLIEIVMLGIGFLFIINPSKVVKENWTRDNYPRGSVIASEPTSPPPPKPSR